jgi:hypothetical protein
MSCASFILSSNWISLLYKVFLIASLNAKSELALWWILKAQQIPG